MTALGLSACSFLVIFFLVPFIGAETGELWRIYDRSYFEGRMFSQVVMPDLLVIALFGLVPVAIFCAYLLPRLSGRRADAGPQPSKRRVALTTNVPRAFWWLIVVAWSVLFFVGGGFGYRAQDVAMGYATRSLALELAFTSQGAATMIAIYLYITRKAGAPLVNFGTTGMLILGAAMAVSGSRGYLLTLIVALVAASYIMAHHRIETGAVARRRAALSPQAIILGGTGFAVLAFLTYQRAGGAEIGFNVLFRLAEPYWVWAFEYAQATGGDPNVALFAVERVLSIPMRFLGVSFPYSIEGHEALFERYFGYIQREGVSLPITIVGEGLLFGGSGGAALFLALQNGMIISSIFFWMQRLKANVGMRIAFGALIASRCLGVTARTSTGSMLVFYYEPLRDILILLAIAMAYQLLAGASSGATVAPRRPIRRQR